MLILTSVNHFNLERAKDIANWGAEGNINKGEMINSLIPLYKKWTGNCHTLSTGKRRGKLWGNTIPNSKELLLVFCSDMTFSSHACPLKMLIFFENQS